jgi:hypothetical protein
MALQGRLGVGAGVLLLLAVTGSANLRALGACLRRRGHSCSRAGPSQRRPHSSRGGTNRAPFRWPREMQLRALSWASWPPSLLLAHSPSLRLSALGRAACTGPSAHSTDAA